MSDTINPFVTLDAKGRPVKQRISSPEAMRTIFTNFKKEDAQEATRRERLLNMYNGNLPYNPEKMREMKLANLTNINLLGLKGYVDARVSAITDLALDVVPLVELRPLPMEKAGPLAQDGAEIVADEWSTTVRDGGSILPCLAMMAKECDLFGLGPVSWQSPDGYEPTALRRGQLKFAMDANVNSSKNEIYMFESPVTIHYFYDILESADKAEKEGWNVKALKRYLAEVYLSEKSTEAEAGDTTGTSTYESTLIEMRQNRWMETNQFRVLRLLHAYVKEYDGKIRHLICSPTSNVPTEDTLPTKDEFIFDKEAAYDHMDQCLLWLPASVVEPEARGVRGVASYVAPIEDVNNRLTCQMYDAGFRAGSFMLVSKSPGQHSQQSIIERGPYTVLPADLVPSQAQVVAPNLQQIASLREMGTSIGYNNATGTRGMGAMPERMYSGADRKTKDQVNHEVEARAKGEQALFAARILVVDKLFREVFRRFMNLVKRNDRRFPEVQDFIKRCEMRGVTYDMLKTADEFFRVYTNRVLVTGGGSAYSGVLFQTLKELGGSFDERGRVLMTRDIIRHQLGAKAADRYRPPGSRDDAPTDAMSLAVLENNSIRRLEPVVVGNDQLHWTHIPIHGQIIDEVAQLYQEQPRAIQDPQQLLDTLLAASQHIQQHVQYGAQQPGMMEAAKQVMSKLASLAPILKGLTLMAATVERQRKAEAERQQKEYEELVAQAEGQETTLAMREQDQKARLKMREQDLMHVARMQKVEQDGEVARSKADQEALVNIAKQTHRIQQGMQTMGKQSMVSFDEDEEM